jgi:hypothetical protein
LFGDLAIFVFFVQVKTFTYSWIARTSSSGDQLSKDALCGFVAAVVACSVVYPIDSTKARGRRLNSSSLRVLELLNHGKI